MQANRLTICQGGMRSSCTFGPLRAPNTRCVSATYSTSHLGKAVTSRSSNLRQRLGTYSQKQQFTICRAAKLEVANRPNKAPLPPRNATPTPLGTPTPLDTRSQKRRTTVCRTAGKVAAETTPKTTRPRKKAVEKPASATGNGNGKKAPTPFQALEDVTSQAMQKNEHVDLLVQGLSEQIQELQHQNRELLDQQKEDMNLKHEYLKQAEARQGMIEELQERDQMFQEMVGKMQGRLDSLMDSLSGSKAAPIQMVERMALSQDEGDRKAAAKLLGDLLADEGALDLYRQEALPLAVKLLESIVEEVQVNAALTLLKLVTKDGKADEQACVQANSLGAGPLVKALLQSASCNGHVEESLTLLYESLLASQSSA